MSIEKNNYEFLEFELDTYLANRLTAADESKIQEIDEEIWSKFGGEWAILFTDLSGFSKNVYDNGLLYTMEVIYMFKNLAIPIIEAHEGIIIKIEGDSFIVLFEKVEQAYRVAIEINAQLEAYNDKQTDRFIYNSSGIGFGKILKINNQDLFGLEVNLASKLGEDIAKGGEILLTRSAKMELEKSMSIHVTEFLMDQNLKIPAFKLKTLKSEENMPIMEASKILLLGDESLYQVSRQVESSERSKILNVRDKLHCTIVAFREKYGVGRAIAAPQIGEFVRIIYMLIDGKSTLFVNPVISFPDDELMEVWDDCMCFPNLLVKVMRYKRCHVSYENENGEKCHVSYEGDLSELIQHEYDHLDGILAVSKAIDGQSFKLRL